MVIASWNGSGTATAGSDGTLQVSGLCRVGRLDDFVEVALVAEDGKTACSTAIGCGTEPRSQPPDVIQTYLRVHRFEVPFLLTIGDTAGIPELLERANDETSGRPTLVGLSVESAAELPTTARGYDVFTTVVINGMIALSPEQLYALKTWVRGGGHLIVSASDNIGELLNTDFGRWLGDRFEIQPETLPVTDTDLAAIQQYVPRSTRISTFRRAVRMASVGLRQPEILARSGTAPMIVRSGSAAGVITFVAVNLNERPLAQWKSLADLYAQLVLGESVSRAISDSESARISSSGVTDLGTQLMASVDALPHTGRWSTLSVMALAFLWLICIGPLDYLFVVVLLKRPHATWVTFPLWVAAALATLFWLKSADENRPVLNAVHVMDIARDGEDSVVQTMSLMSLSVPGTGRMDLAVEPSPQFAAGDDLELTWSGRPENVYGGLYRTGGVGRGQETYRRDVNQPKLLSAVPMLVDGSFEVQARQSLVSARPLVDSTLSASGFSLLQGTFTHHLPEPIHDWILVYGNRVYRARDDTRVSLAPGEVWESRQQRSSIADLKTWISGRRAAREAPQSGIGSDTSQVAYSSRGRDPLDIVTMMSLYEVAGGSNYTGLTHGAFDYMDLSDSVRMNYALLIGWMDSPVTQLILDGKIQDADKSSTVVRLLLPVDRREASAQALTRGEIEELERQQREREKANRAPDAATPANDDAFRESSGEKND